MRKLFLLFALALLSITGYGQGRSVLLGDTLILRKGASINGRVDVGTHRIINVLDPVDDQDALTLKYFDDHAITGEVPFLDFEVNTDDPIYQQARLWYDSLHAEMVFFDRVTDLKFGTVSEVSIRIINNNGFTLNIGDVVYPSGVSGGFTTAALAKSDAFDTSRPVGVIKNQILNGEVGWVTIRGEVDNVNTSLLSPGIIYVSPTSAGDMTSTKPTGGNFIIRVGPVKDIGVNGSIIVDPFTNEYTAEIISPRGWSSDIIAATSISPVSSTRTASIVGTGYVYEAGVKYPFDNPSVVWDDIEGTVDVYFDEGVLVAENNRTDTQVREIYSAKSGVSRMYWDTANDTIIFANDMRHTFDMNGNTWATFWDIHKCTVLGGLGLVDIQTDGTGNADADAQFGHDAGTIRNQDIITSIPAIASTTGFTVFYREGTSSWRSQFSTGFPVLNEVSLLAWNEDVAGTWQLSQVGNGDFVLCHLFVSNTLGLKTGVVMGQNDYATLTAARDGARAEIQDLLFSQFPIQELSPVATVIYETRTNYNNGVKARTRQSLDQFGNLVDYIDWTRTDVASGGTGGGTSSFLGDTDTPSTYAGAAGQAAVVSGTEDALIFSDVVTTINGDSPTTGNYDIVSTANKIGENVTIGTVGTGTDAVFSVADNDNVIGNEYQDLSNSKLNNTVTIDISNGTGTTVTNLARTDFANNFINDQLFSLDIDVTGDVEASSMYIGDEAQTFGGDAELVVADADGAFVQIGRAVNDKYQRLVWGTFDDVGAVEYKNGATSGTAYTFDLDNFTITGATTSPNFISTVTSGAQPYATSSAALNTNLNADLLDGLHASSFLQGNQNITLTGEVTGSGTTSISTSVASDVIGANELRVTGNGNTSQFLRSDGDGTFSWIDNIYFAGDFLDKIGTTFNVDLSELTTSTSNVDGAFFVTIGSTNLQRKLTKGSINLSGFNNDVGYISDNQNITLSGDVTGSGTTAITTVVGDDSHNHTAATITLASTDLTDTGNLIRTSDVDDIPVNGATTSPISSNWAFDHDANASAHHNPVTITGENYASLSTQQITFNDINLSTNVTGTLADGNLSNNVALKNIDNNFTVLQSITGGLAVGGSTVITSTRDIVNAESGSFGNQINLISTGGKNRLRLLQSDVSTGGNVSLGIFGKSESINEAAVIRYVFDNTESNRYIGLGFWGNDDVVKIFTSGNSAFTGIVTATNVFKKAVNIIAGTTPTYDCSISVNAEIALTGNTTVTFTNLIDGMSGNLDVTQDVTGGRTISFLPLPDVVNGGNGVITLTGTALSNDVISWYYSNTRLKVTVGLNFK